MIITPAQRKADHNMVIEREHFRQVLNRLKDRCNDPRHKEYELYGGRGASYPDKWNDLDGFIDDVDKIEGWNEEKFNAHKLFLDKDIKNPGNITYSVNNCLWVSKRVNQIFRPSKLDWFYGYQLDTKTLVLTNSRTLFRTLHGGIVDLHEVLDGRKHATNGWYLWYKDEPIPRIEDVSIHLPTSNEVSNQKTASTDIREIIDKGLTNIENVYDNYRLFADSE